MAIIGNRKSQENIQCSKLVDHVLTLSSLRLEVYKRTKRSLYQKANFLEELFSGNCINLSTDMAVSVGFVDIKYDVLLFASYRFFMSISTYGILACCQNRMSCCKMICFINLQRSTGVWRCEFSRIILLRGNDSGKTFCR